MGAGRGQGDLRAGVPPRGAADRHCQPLSQAHRERSTWPDSFLIFRVAPLPLKGLNSHWPREKNNDLFKGVQKPKTGQINTTIGSLPQWNRTAGADNWAPKSTIERNT